MPGVTVLQTIEKYNYTWGRSPHGIFFIAIGIALLILCIYITAEYCQDVGFLAIIGFALIIIGIFSCATFKQILKGYQYQVIIDDSVSMNEFIKHYNIIEQQGMTYIVEEKEGS